MSKTLSPNNLIGTLKTHGWQRRGSHGSRASSGDDDLLTPATSYNGDADSPSNMESAMKKVMAKRPPLHPLGSSQASGSPLGPSFMVSAPGKVIVYGEHAVVHGKVHEDLQVLCCASTDLT